MASAFISSFFCRLGFCGLIATRGNVYRQKKKTTSFGTLNPRENNFY